MPILNLSMVLVTYSILRYFLFRGKHHFLMLFTLCLFTLALSIKLNVNIQTNSGNTTLITYFMSIHPLVSLLMVLTLLVTSLLIYLFFYLRKHRYLVLRFKRKRKKTLKDWVILWGSVSFFSLGLLFFFICRWLLTTFGNIEVNQILYHIQEPIEGSGSQQIVSFLDRSKD